MKIDYISDLHLDGFIFKPDNEFFDVLFKPQQSDILILCGDIKNDLFFLNHGANVFLKYVAEKYERVILILGNHDYYNSYKFCEIPRYDSLSKLSKIFKKEIESQFSNITILENESFMWNGVKFIGSTFWSNADSKNAKLYERAINDYSMIDGLTVRKTNLRHSISKKYVFSEVDSNKDIPCVVCTHHAPSYKCVAPMFKDSVINCMFVNDLDTEIKIRPNIKAWIHGHVHHTIDTMIGNTHIVANPFGYMTHPMPNQPCSEIRVSTLEI